MQNTQKSSDFLGSLWKALTAQESSAILEIVKTA
jgi:hypothetical protein